MRGGASAPSRSASARRARGRGRLREERLVLRLEVREVGALPDLEDVAVADGRGAQPAGGVSGGAGGAAEVTTAKPASLPFSSQMPTQTRASGPVATISSSYV